MAYPPVTITPPDAAREALNARLEQGGYGITPEQAKERAAARAAVPAGGSALNPYQEYVMAWPEGQEGMMTHKEFETLKLQKSGQYQQGLQELQAQGSQLTNAQLQALEFAKGVV